MRLLPAVASAAIIAVGALVGCASAATEDLAVGDCLKMGGTPERPEATKVACGSPESNFKVAATSEGSEGSENGDQCPMDVDSYYSMRSAFSDTSTTICMDIDWVVGGCMSIDPENDKDPLRVDCNDDSVPNRQRATEILQGVANAHQCESGLGYAYDERDFTVCVEDVT